METVKCTMCKSEWLLDYREHAFYPGKKTCKTCTNRSAMVRLRKKHDTLIEQIKDIVSYFKNALDDPDVYDIDHNNMRIYSLNDFKTILYGYHTRNE